MADTTPNTGIGREIYALAARLFPICRSLTGDGVRQTLDILAALLPGLQVHEVPTGTRCFDWTVPDEWNIRDAYIIDPDGRKIVDFRHNNLHVVGYSEPVDLELPLDELTSHLHSDPARPEVIPYRTSYYERCWGYCLSHAQLKALRPGTYRVRIESTLKPGAMTYGELILPGVSTEEVFLSTYICHPSMANNEVSGIAVTAFAARWLMGRTQLRRTHRIVFVPETLGSICCLARNLETMKARMAAGFNVTCVGDDRAYSYLKSRAEDTLADKVARHVVKHMSPECKVYPHIKSGSDERQYCMPGVDLPVVSIMRTKYAEYHEYHSSLDNLDLISPSGLEGGYTYLVRCLECLERNERLRLTTLCQPQLGKRGLYPTLSRAKLETFSRNLVDFLTYADGSRLLDIAEKMGVAVWDLFDIVERLKQEGLLEVPPSS